MSHLIALVAGALFALGLMISGMTRPERVQGFLDVFGRWDPTLAFVMVGAIGVYSAIYRLSAGRMTLQGVRIAAPAITASVDRPLVLGAVLFGAGWAISGFCPGPALTSAATGDSSVWVFLVSMLVGMGVFGRLRARRARRIGRAGTRG